MSPLHARPGRPVSGQGPCFSSTSALPDLDAFIRAQIARDTKDVHGETHRQVDKLLLVRALEHTGGNQREAARTLGISRQTMRTKLRSLGLTVNLALEMEDESC
jgi:DNA-binding protein Fis